MKLQSCSMHKQCVACRSRLSTFSKGIAIVLDERARCFQLLKACVDMLVGNNINSLSNNSLQTTDTRTPASPLPSVNTAKQEGRGSDCDALPKTTCSSPHRQAVSGLNSQLKGSSSQAATQMKGKAVVQQQQQSSGNVNAVLESLADELSERVLVSAASRTRPMTWHVNQAKSRQEAFASSAQAVQALVEHLPHDSGLDMRQMSEMAATNPRKCFDTIVTKMTPTDLQEASDPDNE